MSRLQEKFREILAIHQRTIEAAIEDAQKGTSSSSAKKTSKKKSSSKKKTSDTKED